MPFDVQLRAHRLRPTPEHQSYIFDATLFFLFLLLLCSNPLITIPNPQGLPRPFVGFLLSLVSLLEPVNKDQPNEQTTARESRSRSRSRSRSTSSLARLATHAPASRVPTPTHIHTMVPPPTRHRDRRCSCAHMCACGSLCVDCHAVRRPDPCRALPAAERSAEHHRPDLPRSLRRVRERRLAPVPLVWRVSRC